MNITINNIHVEADPDETLLETARRVCISIPSLCYAKGASHKSSCMVCAVKNLQDGQIIPSCTTLPSEGMRIETESEEVKQVRTLSLELLLSDHRADCEAPCSMVCPRELDVERMLSYYDTRRYEEAHAVISSAFNLPDIACDTCKTPCEKACRRGTIDTAVSIRDIIREVVAMFVDAPRDMMTEYKNETIGKNRYFSRLGRFSPKEKERLKETVGVPSRCLHCACSGRSGCMLRLYATREGIKRSRYEASSELPVMTRQHINGNIWFEQAKCIRCGLCVYNTNNGFAFKSRGFGMQVVIPMENCEGISENIAKLCPTGAIYLEESVYNVRYLR